ncbi:MAG TPA: L-threonylcarbamoyladenylate synthase [bacterium]|nr:L-threonylcarbamoyladenylate synthase [bacterium]
MAARPSIIKISRDLPEWETISRAARVVTDGGIIAFPTDTTYGLAASIHCKQAVARLKRLKSRKSGQPFLVIAADLDWVRELAVVKAGHRRLMDTYWPGPLSIVFQASRAVPAYVAGPGRTIAIRIPDDTLTQSILRACGVPLVAPSANLRGKEPATSARAVVRDFGDRVDLVLDGGSTDSTTPSTIVAIGSRGLEVLRPGRLVVREA